MVETINEYQITDEQVNAIQAIQDTIHAYCVNASWYSDINTGKRINRNFGEAIALMHSELSEALEGYRKNLMDDHLPHRNMVEVEFADTIIRILDTAGYMDLDVAGAIREKFEYNQTRADHKVKNRRKQNGKKI